MQFDRYTFIDGMIHISQIGEHNPGSNYQCYKCRSILYGIIDLEKSKET